jgi:glycosyltransferase involved in cell wall biosynthesis
MIARMNVGGPAHHVSILSGRLMADHFDTLLVAGRVGPGEEAASDLASYHGARLRTVPPLGPQMRPLYDARALSELVAIMRAFRPHIVHTHTAKAGMLGRIAALCVSPRPLLVHTYHGHVLSGYFSRPRQSVYRLLERRLAMMTQRLVGVSQATVDDLVRLRIAPPEAFEVIPLGLDLAPFASVSPLRGSGFRREIGARDDELVLTFAGRLAPIKRVGLLLEAVALARRSGAPLRLAVVGDGEQRGILESRSRSLGLAGCVRFLGYRRDLPSIAAGTDVAVLASANEGTPVALIESAAAGIPAVATDVGGVGDVVTPQTGILVSPGAHIEFAEALRSLAADPVRRAALGRNARQRVLERYSMERLARDTTQLYESLLTGLNRRTRG